MLLKSLTRVLRCLTTVEFNMLLSIHFNKEKNEYFWFDPSVYVARTLTPVLVKFWRWSIFMHRYSWKWIFILINKCMYFQRFNLVVQCWHGVLSVSSTTWWFVLIIGVVPALNKNCSSSFSHLTTTRQRNTVMNSTKLNLRFWHSNA